MQNKVNDLAVAAAEVGLRINIRKTKLMKINTTSSNSVNIDGAPIEEVAQFNYLGSLITTDGGAIEDIKSRLSKAQAAFGRLWSCWKSTKIARGTKLRVFNACVKSVLLYGSETWLINKISIQKIQVFINKCLRIICRIFWPETIINDDLWQLTKQEPIELQIRKRKYRWIGHALRKPKNSIARQALDWSPQGKRSIGRPRNTWKRTVLKEIKVTGKN